MGWPRPSGVTNPLPADVLSPDTCVPSKSGEILPDDLELGELSSVRGELTMVDAGNIWVSLDGERQEVPASLMPDLLPYMSGVEYLLREEFPLEIGRDETSIIVEAEPLAFVVMNVPMLESTSSSQPQRE